MSFISDDTTKSPCYLCGKTVNDDGNSGITLEVEGRLVLALCFEACFAGILKRVADQMRREIEARCPQCPTRGFCPNHEAHIVYD